LVDDNCQGLTFTLPEIVEILNRFFLNTSIIFGHSPSRRQAMEWGRRGFHGGTCSAWQVDNSDIIQFGGNGLDEG
jgi:hypothetical protein